MAVKVAINGFGRIGRLALRLMIENNEFEVVGGFIDELVRGVVLSDFQSFSYFQKVLKDKGIIKELKKRGADEFSTIRIKDIEFEIKE